MDIIKLEEAKSLQMQIKLLKERIASYDPEQRYVYLHVKDHYGNGGNIIETYAFGPDTSKAMGIDLETLIAYSYGEFLSKVKDGLLARIDFLEAKLEQL